MILAHKISLDPTVEQSIALAKACGCARFTFNWALDRWQKDFKAGLKPTALKLKTEWNKIKAVEFPWILESPKDANQQPFANVDTAFKRFFKKQAKYPTFKSKGKHDSFYISNDKLSVEQTRIRLPVIGWIRATEPLRFDGKILSATVSCTADRWFVSISVEAPDTFLPRTEDKQVGIDLGINTTLVCSDGQALQSPRPLKRYLKTLKRRSRAHSRKVKGSNNRKKSQRRLARLHARISNIRRDWTHKVTTKIVRENQTICLEDLHVKGMAKKLGRSIQDVSFYEIRRQIEYKAKRYGSTVTAINRWLPSSKCCSNCGCTKDVLARSERIYSCDHCGFKLDRDLNAALNILAAGLAATACGQKGSDDLCNANRETSLDEARTTPNSLVSTK